MKTLSGNKIDLEKVVELYLRRFKGQPDATRLIVNMLADKVTDLNVLLSHIIRHEFATLTVKPKASKDSAIQQLSETYGLSKREIQEIVG